MKTLMISMLLLVGVIGANAQSNRVYLAQDSSFTSTDTTAWVSVGSMTHLTLVVLAPDSFNVALRLDYRPSDADASVFQSYNVEADSTNSTVDAGFFKGWVLRDGNTDNIPGAEKIRLITTVKTTRNGVDPGTYSAWVDRP